MNESTLVPREEMSDLDWLARNVHVWRFEQEYIYVMKDQDENRSVSVFAYHSFYSKFSRNQWLARRAELQNKPSWKYVPDWVMWISQDGSGNWWIYETEPKSILDFRGGRHWSCNDGSCESLLNYSGEVLGDHLDTLEKRPEQKSFEPFVSVEDVKITIMQSDGDVKHFGGIIGRSLLLEEDAATAKQHDPVNSPSHYASGGIECIDAIKASMSHEAFLGYLKGNVQKYMWRYEKKVNPSEDLKKARWYLDKLIEEQK